MTAPLTSQAAPTSEPRSNAAAPGRPFVARPQSGHPSLAVIVYHYVRDGARSRFPRIKGVSIDDFREQVGRLRERYEMASLESALAFLNGTYRPSRSMCLLTFDDGLRDHYRDVFPTLRDAGIQGLFFLTTGCLEGTVANVHKNHHLLAELEFSTYRDAVVGRLDAQSLQAVDAGRAGLAYPWDPADVAAVKYLLNYQLPPERRREILDSLFAEFIGDEGAFADELYLSSTEAREMQTGGMLMGGHSHEHSPLSSLDDREQQIDVATCASRLRDALSPQALWPFSYPYGHFNTATIECLRTGGFHCSFALDGGDNGVSHDPFRIRRIDTKDLVF